MSFKSDALASIDHLPNKATYLDIQYNLYVLNKVKMGEVSIKNSGVINHHDVVKKFEKWLTK